MQHIIGISRQQLQISSLEDKITSDNLIRFIEAFVENISLQALGFTAQTIKTEGRLSPACLPAGLIPKCFLKFIYTDISTVCEALESLKKNVPI